MGFGALGLGNLDGLLGPGFGMMLDFRLQGQGFGVLSLCSSTSSSNLKNKNTPQAGAHLNESRKVGISQTPICKQAKHARMCHPKVYD